MGCSSRLESGIVAADRELAGFMRGLDGTGAVVSFCGIARGLSKGGEAVDALHLDHYPGMTEASLQTIAEAGMHRFDVSDVAVVHRCGTIAPGEVIVFVATASRFRRAAFEAADYLMDRLKTEAVFWKREQSSGGSRWIEPTEADRADAARWEEPCPESTKA